MAHTIRFAGMARFGDEIRAFHTYGPSPTRVAYEEVIGRWSASPKGEKAAREFIAQYPTMRGSFGG